MHQSSALNEELLIPVNCFIVNEYMEQRRCKYTSLSFINDLVHQTFSIFAKQIMLKIMSEMQKRHFISAELMRIMLYQTRNSGIFLSSIPYKVIWHITNMLHIYIDCHKHTILHNGISTQVTFTGTYFVFLFFLCFCRIDGLSWNRSGNIYNYIINVLSLNVVDLYMWNQLYDPYM